jgi:hypothetical protein
VASLNDQWQAARQLRQNTAENRREQVLVELSHWQQERLAYGVHLRQNLAQQVNDLQAETSQWLAQTAEQRQAQIPRLRQTLQCYTEQLQVKTQALLSSYQADLQLKAAAQQQQLWQDRQWLHDAIIETQLGLIQDLQAIQQQVWVMKQQVAVDRAGYRQHQALTKASLWPELASYVASLQTEVEATLTSLTEARQEAEANRRKQRQQERLALSASVHEIFDQLGEFRRQLQAQRSQLTTQVWGIELTEPNAPPTAQIIPNLPPKAELRPVARLATTNSRSTPSTNRAKPPTVTVAQPASTVSPMPLVRPSAPRSTPQISEPVAVPSSPSTVVAPMAVPSFLTSPSQPLEEVVYNYLHLANGARLSEIETELGINRFQAVDALRALIQRNLIVKQDRTYCVLEEAVL